MGHRDIISACGLTPSEIDGGTPEQFAAFVRTEAIKWADVVKKTGAKVE